MKTMIPAPAPPTKARHVTIEFREDVPFSPELKALLEGSETETTTTPPPKPDANAPTTVRFNLD